MLESFYCFVRLTSCAVTVLVHCDQGDILKARLDLNPRHPRALLTFLEGLSLWSGKPICAVVSVAQDCPRSAFSRLFGDELWPGESGLVRFELDNRARHPVRLRGVGDFRAVRGGLRRSVA